MSLSIIYYNLLLENSMFSTISVILNCMLSDTLYSDHNPALLWFNGQITLWGAVQCADSGCFWTLVTATLHSGGLPF